MGEGRAVQLQHEGVDCHVVGVCHLSAQSAQDARAAVRRHDPSIVCVELCDERTMFLSGSGTREKDILPPLTLETWRKNWHWLIDPMFWFISLQLTGLEALLGSSLGAEQAAAAEAAKEVGATVVMADRAQSVTLGRTLASLASFLAIVDFARALRSADAALVPGLVREVAELELLILSRDLSSSDFARASALARTIVDTLLNNARAVPSLGHAGRAIQEERDFILGHALFHACCAAKPTGRPVVAVLGAAHLPGVEQHFPTFQHRGCSRDACGVQPEMQALHEVPLGPLLGAGATLLCLSGASLGARWYAVRYFRRTRGDAWARRFGRFSVAAAVGLGVFGLYRASWQYNAVRALQLHRERLRASGQG